jgi:hypothetical protein
VVSLSLSLSLWFCSPLIIDRFFSFPILWKVCGTPWTGDQPVAKPLPTHRTTQTQNKRTQTSLPRVGFEPTTPVFERTKTVHALDRADTVIGSTAVVCLHLFEENVASEAVSHKFASYSEAVKLKCQSGDRLSWHRFVMVFLSSSRKMLRQYFIIGCILFLLSSVLIFYSAVI